MASGLSYSKGMRGQSSQSSVSRYGELKAIPSPKYILMLSESAHVFTISRGLCVCVRFIHSVFRRNFSTCRRSSTAVRVSNEYCNLLVWWRFANILWHRMCVNKFVVQLMEHIRWHTEKESKRIKKNVAGTTSICHSFNVSHKQRSIRELSGTSKNIQNMYSHFTFMHYAHIPNRSIWHVIFDVMQYAIHFDFHVAPLLTEEKI